MLAVCYVMILRIVKDIGKIVCSMQKQCNFRWFFENFCFMLSLAPLLNCHHLSVQSQIVLGHDVKSGTPAELSSSLVIDLLNNAQQRL